MQPTANNVPLWKEQFFMLTPCTITSLEKETGGIICGLLFHRSHFLLWELLPHEPVDISISRFVLNEKNPWISRQWFILDVTMTPRSQIRLILQNSPGKNMRMWKPLVDKREGGVVLWGNEETVLSERMSKIEKQKIKQQVIKTAMLNLAIYHVKHLNCCCQMFILYFTHNII